MVAIIHYLFKKDSDEVVQDEYMYVCYFHEPLGDLVSSEEGENSWVAEKLLPAALAKPFVPIENYLKIVDIVNENSGELKFFEISSRTKDF
jgi:hypothetical protein